MSNRKVNRKVYYAFDIELSSPLSVSAGTNELTDSDIIRDSEGRPFIPGTSIAGAFRNYLDKKKNEKCQMGYSDGESGCMSSIYISDMHFDTVTNTSVRDYVKLKTRKHIVENKFDVEIIETGSRGTMYVSYIVRDGEDSDDYEQLIYDVVHGMDVGDIRFGGKKNRGNGYVKVGMIHRAIFEADKMQEYLNFVSRRKSVDSYAEHYELSDWNTNFERQISNYIHIIVPLKQRGGISIKRYSTVPKSYDYEHIKCNDIPVIPGSSIAGAIRSAIYDYLTELNLSGDKIKSYIDEWFGKVSDKTSDDAYQSLISVKESIIENGKNLRITRNRIDRFDASTIDGALYTESAVFDGKAVIDILVRKDSTRHYKALVKLLMFAIEDLQEGFISIGGQSGIGRGIFEQDSCMEIVYSEPIDTSFDTELTAMIREGR